jgi:hypothetical protein
LVAEVKSTILRIPADAMHSVLANVAHWREKLSAQRTASPTRTPFESLESVLKGDQAHEGAVLSRDQILGMAKGKAGTMLDDLLASSTLRTPRFGDILAMYPDTDSSSSKKPKTLPHLNSNGNPRHVGTLTDQKSLVTTPRRPGEVDKSEGLGLASQQQQHVAHVEDKYAHVIQGGIDPKIDRYHLAEYVFFVWCFSAKNICSILPRSFKASFLVCSRHRCTKHLQLQYFVNFY